MSLRLIYGRAGTGKSEFCFNEICSRINEEEKIYVITPEQFSFTFEKRLLSSLKTNACINAEVLSFNRMAYRISRRSTEALLKLIFRNLVNQCLCITYFLPKKIN